MLLQTKTTKKNFKLRSEKKHIFCGLSFPLSNYKNHISFQKFKPKVSTLITEKVLAILLKESTKNDYFSKKFEWS